MTPEQRQAALERASRRSGDELGAIASAALFDYEKLRQAVIDALRIVDDGSLPTTGQAMHVLRAALAVCDAHSERI